MMLFILSMKFLVLCENVIPVTALPCVQWRRLRPASRQAWKGIFEIGIKRFYPVFLNYFS